MNPTLARMIETTIRVANSGAVGEYDAITLRAAAEELRKIERGELVPRSELEAAQRFLARAHYGNDGPNG